jgi:chromate reductase
MKVVAFAASSSKKSINKQLVTYAASLLEDCQAEVLDINDYELPLFSEDREAELGKPALAKAFLEKIGDSDAVIISFAEHNGSYSAAYKSLFDWCSRINPKVFQNRPMVLLSTSPGPGGAGSVLAAATASAPFFDGDVKATLSIPKFYENFDMESGAVKNSELNSQLLSTVRSLL